MKDLIVVFTDTEQKSDKYTQSKTTKQNHVEGPFLSEYNGNISVENSDTVTSLVKWSKIGKTAILNMASPYRPGGGVRNGARAQEECLFRCSNLVRAIDSTHYPIKKDECIYTQDAVFFKDVNYDYMEPVTCDVVTIPALNLNKEEFNDQDYETITREKIRIMLSVPYKFGVKNIILGAWGCGVFGNNPEKIAQYFKDAIITEGYSSLYENVVFAIINDHNSVANNFEIFNKILND